MLKPGIILLMIGWMPQGLADSVEMIFFSLSTPKAWHVTVDQQSKLFASPNVSENGDMSPPALSVESLPRSSNSKAFPPCETTAINDNFFYFFKNHPAVRYWEIARSDGYVEYHASGEFHDDGSQWVAGCVVCGQGGIVYIGMVSDESQKQADDQLNSIVKSLKWKGAKVSKKTALRRLLTVKKDD